MVADYVEGVKLYTKCEKQYETGAKSMQALRGREMTKVSAASAAHLALLELADT